VSTKSRSPVELLSWLEAAPPGTLLDAAALAGALREASVDVCKPLPEPSPATWRERLWTVPPETRIGVAELCEALGRTRSWVWRHTGPKAPGPRIPHRKLEGELVFVVGEIRLWVKQHETVIAESRPALVVTRRSGGRKARAST